jgi:rhomboid domain-containing protein 1
MSNRHHERNGRPRGLSPILLSLFYQLFQQLQQSDYNPPVTIALLGINIFVHVHPYPEMLGFNLSDIRSNCIHPSLMIRSWQFYQVIEWNRLLLSSLIHADDIHLYYNMLSLSWKGINLERSLGSFRFLQFVIFSLVVAHSLMVFLSFALYNIIGMDEQLSGFNSCAVGFSAVLFSLKYVWNSSCRDYTTVMGIQIPTKYAAWAELVLISIVTPNASFLGHLCGIFAGALYLHGVLDVLLLLPLWMGNTFKKFFVERPVELVADDIPLEDVDDLHTADPLNVRFVDNADVRQRRLRKFAGRFQ